MLVDEASTHCESNVFTMGFPILIADSQPLSFFSFETNPLCFLCIISCGMHSELQHLVREAVSHALVNTKQRPPFLNQDPPFAGAVQYLYIFKMSHGIFLLSFFVSFKMSGSEF